MIRADQSVNKVVVCERITIYFCDIRVLPVEQLPLQSQLTHYRPPRLYSVFHQKTVLLEHQLHR